MIEAEGEEVIYKQMDDRLREILWAVGRGHIYEETGSTWRYCSACPLPLLPMGEVSHGKRTTSDTLS